MDHASEPAGQTNEPVPTGRYQHYKGAEYTVLGVATHSETGEELVVYRPEYGARGLWVRPKAMFCERVRTPEGEVPRFRWLGSASPDSGAAGV
jgi:hypothetical protein